MRYLYLGIRAIGCTFRIVVFGFTRVVVRLVRAPVDLHITGLEQLGGNYADEGYVKARVDGRLKRGTYCNG